MPSEKGESSIEIPALHAALAEHFSIDELKILCHDAGIDPDTVPYAERGKDLYAFCIAGAFRGKDQLPALLRECASQRPGVDWTACRVETAVPAEWAELFTQQNLIQTQGGAAFVGTFTVTGDLVGRDKITITEETSYTVAGLPNPYLGLQPFTYAERERYAGRTKAVAEAVAQLTAPGQERALLFITGASGSGKSSFAQAGLVPALEAHYTARGQRVRWAVFRPGERSMAMLEDARRQLAAQAGDVDVLIVDQFEELFTRSQLDERAVLFDWLTSLPSFAQTRQHVIATLRSDYLEELFDAKAVWDLSKQNSVELRAMSVDELKDAIQRPLQARYPDGVKRFEPALLDRLAQDASASPTLLPLLQVTLEALWKQGRLVLAAYGTLTDAIKERADRVLQFHDYDAASPSQPRSAKEQAAVLATLVDLVSVSLDEDPRLARVSWTLEELGTGRRALVDDLVRARLLSTAGGGEAETVTIIHESLIANWGRLKAAVQAERERLQMRARFEAALREWAAAREPGSGRNPADYLLTGVWLAQGRALEQAGDVALASEAARAFLRASAEAEAAEQARELEQARKLAEEQRARADEQAEARQRLRKRALALVVALVLAVGAVVAAVVFANRAQQNATLAQAAQDTAVAEARRAESNAATAEAARYELWRDTGQVRVGKSPSAMVFDGSLLWVASHDDSLVQGIDLNEGRIRYSVGVDRGPAALVLDGQQLWVASQMSNTVQSIDPTHGRLARRIRVGPQPIALALGGGYLWVATQGDNSIRAIDAATGKVIVSQKVPSPLASGPQSLAFAQDTLWIATDGGVSTYQPETKLSGPHPHPRPGSDVCASAIASDGMQIWRIRSHDPQLTAVDPASKMLTAGTEIRFDYGDISAAAIDTSSGEALMWLASTNERSVRAADLAMRRVSSPIPLAGRPVALTFAGNELFAAIQDPSVVQRVSIGLALLFGEAEISQKLPTSHNCPDSSALSRVRDNIDEFSVVSSACDADRIGIAGHTPRGDEAWDEKIVEFDRSSGEWRWSIDSEGVTALVYAPVDGHRILWVTKGTDNTLRALDSENNGLELAYYKVIPRPEFMWLDDRRLWIANADKTMAQYLVLFR